MADITLLRAEPGVYGRVASDPTVSRTVDRLAEQPTAALRAQLLHAMGVFGPQAPATIRAFGTSGQHSPAQLIDRYGLRCRPVRDVLVSYLAERQPMLDHTTLRDLAFSLGGLFWRDLERDHPGICSLHLAPRSPPPGSSAS